VEAQQLLEEVRKALEAEELLVGDRVPGVDVAVDPAVGCVEAVL
jgi:hypothetical protein